MRVEFRLVNQQMSRNVTILIIILLIIVIAGYLVWLRGKFQTSQNAATITPSPQEMVVTPLPTLTTTPQATLSATPKVSTSSAKIAK